MFDDGLLKQGAPAAAVCLILILLYVKSGLMAVVVAAAMVDIALRCIQESRQRRPAPRAAETGGRNGM